LLRLFPKSSSHWALGNIKVIDIPSICIQEF
jgi:hypothetical protein